MLNIIVRESGKVAHWDKVVEKIHQRENSRRNWFNRGGYKLIGEQAERIAASLNTDRIMAIPTWLDGKLMDNAREVTGSTEWRRNPSYLRWLVRQPEMAWLKKNYKKQIEQLLSESDESTVTPFYEKDAEGLKARQRDMDKLPSHYRGDVGK